MERKKRTHARVSSLIQQAIFLVMISRLAFSVGLFVMLYSTSRFEKVTIRTLAYKPFNVGNLRRHDDDFDVMSDRS